MKCKAVVREIEEMDAGAPLSVEARAHLLTCASCNAFNEERASLRRLVGSLEKVSAPEDFDWRLRARLIEAGSEANGARPLRSLFTPGAVGLAASFLFMVVAVITYQQIKVLPSRATAPDTIASGDKKGTTGGAEEAASSNAKPQAATTNAGSSDVVAKSISNGTPRARAAKSVKATSARAEIASAATPQRIFSNDSGSRGAEEFTISEFQNSFTDAGPVFPVPVRSLKPASLQLEDGHGTRRTLAPVSFGGQELIERKDAARIVTASEKGIW